MNAETEGNKIRVHHMAWRLPDAPQAASEEAAFRISLRWEEPDSWNPQPQASQTQKGCSWDINSLIRVFAIIQCGNAWEGWAASSQNMSLQDWPHKEKGSSQHADGWALPIPANYTKVESARSPRWVSRLFLIGSSTSGRKQSLQRWKTEDHG